MCYSQYISPYYCVSWGTNANSTCHSLRNKKLNYQISYWWNCSSWCWGCQYRCHCFLHCSALILCSCCFSLPICWVLPPLLVNSESLCSLEWILFRSCVPYSSFRSEGRLYCCGVEPSTLLSVKITVVNWDSHHILLLRNHVEFIALITIFRLHITSGKMTILLDNIAKDSNLKCLYIHN